MRTNERSRSFSSAPLSLAASSSKILRKKKRWQVHCIKRHASQNYFRHGTSQTFWAWRSVVGGCPKRLSRTGAREWSLLPTLLRPAATPPPSEIGCLFAQRFVGEDYHASKEATHWNREMAVPHNKRNISQTVAYRIYRYACSDRA